MIHKCMDESDNILDKNNLKFDYFFWHKNPELNENKKGFDIL